MATITSLAFNITSKWDGKGVTAARRDLDSLQRKLDELDRAEHNIRVTLDTDQVDEEIRRISNRADERLKVQAEVDVDDSEASKLRDKRVKITADAETAAADAQITHVARDRHMFIHMDSDGLAKLIALNMLLRALYISILIVVAGFLLIGPAAALAGSLVVAGLGAGFIAVAALALKSNEEIIAGFERLKTAGTEVFQRAAMPMKDALVGAMDQVADKLYELEGLFTEIFANTAPLVEPLVSGLMQLAGNALPGINTALANAGPVFAGLENGLGRLGAGLNGMFVGLSTGAEGFGTAITIALSQVGSFLSILGFGFGQMAEKGSIALDGLLGGINNILQGIMTGMSGALDQMAGPFSAFLREFGSTLGGALATILPAIGQLIGALSQAAEPVFALLGDQLSQTIAGLIESLVPVLEGMVPYIEAGAAAFAEILRALDPMLPILGPLAAGIWLVNAALAANPVVLIIGALAALVVGLVALEQKTQVISRTWNSVWEVARPIFESIVNLVKGPAVESFNALKDGVLDLWHEVQPSLQGLWEALKPLWEQLKPFLAGVLVAVGALVSGLWGALNGAIRPIFTMIGELLRGLINAVTGIVEIVTGMFQSLKGGLQILFGIFQTVGGLIKGLVTGDFSMFRAGLNTIKEGALQVWEGIKSGLEGLWHVINGLWQGIVAIVKGAVMTVIDTVKGFVEGVINFFEWLYDTLVGHSIVPDLMDRIKELFLWLPNQIVGIVRDFGSTVVRLFTEMGQNIWDVVSGAFQRLKDGIPGILSELVGLITDVWGGIEGVFATPINFVIRVWNDHVAGKFGLPEMDEIQHRADGGGIQGYGGPREDNIPVWASAGEHMWTAEEVNAAGGHRAVEALRASVLRRQSGGGIEMTPHQQTMWDAVAGAFPNATLTSGLRHADVGSGFDYHMQGKAIDVDGPRFSIANWIADTFMPTTLELILGDGFGRNIWNGQPHQYSASTLADHGGGNAHVHWANAVPVGFAGAEGMGSTLIQGQAQATNIVRKFLSGLFDRLTNPLINAIPNPALGMGEPLGGFPQNAARKVRDGISDKIKGAEAAAVGSLGDVGGTIPEGERLAIIDEALALTNTPPPGTVDEWRRGLNTLITRESSWNPTAHNMGDSNASIGGSIGLMQTVPDTFSSNAVPGHTDIRNPVDNVAAGINYIKRQYGSISNVQQANANMPPKGYEDGTLNADPGWSLVGENGPEMVKFRGREPVHSFDDIVTRLQDPQLDLANRGQKAFQDFFKANLDQFGSDLTGGSVTEGMIGQLFKQGGQYIEEHIHYHVSDMDEAIRKEKQRERERALGFQ